ncbi:MAG TPA: hypothetical protein VK669_01785 [Candidatus Limnocylindrales bacterium]|nr:hypothetical protein [Candidatus Limnocylindrales bacterium]
MPSADASRKWLRRCDLPNGWADYRRHGLGELDVVTIELDRALHSGMIWTVRSASCANAVPTDE